MMDSKHHTAAPAICTAITWQLEVGSDTAHELDEVRVLHRMERPASHDEGYTQHFPPGKQLRRRYLDSVHILSNWCIRL